MLERKYIRLLMLLIAVMLLVGLFALPGRQPVITNAAQLATAPPRATSDVGPPPPPSGGGQDGGSDTHEIQAAIYGQVIDLSTGQPGQGLEVVINGSAIRTDSEGRYSLTGLKAGTYTAVLRLPSQATAAPQSSVVVHLADKQTVTLDLNYYSQTPPAPPPTLQVEPQAEIQPPAPPLPAVEAPVTYAFMPAPQDTRNAPSPVTPFAGKGPMVWINPGRINNEQEVAGNIAIDVANVNDFGGFQATLRFDPDVIQVDNITVGDFLDSTGRQANPLVTEIDNTQGKVSLIAFTSGDTDGPIGNGTLAVVNFTPKRAGLSMLELDNVLLVARLGQRIRTDVANGQVNVIVCFGEVNGDGVIDVLDVQAVAGRVNQVLGDPDYVPEYDLNNNGMIDPGDVTIVTDRLYETCP